MIQKKALITDIDNTLFDWFTMWHRSFSTMMKEVSKISGIPTEDLYTDAKKVHQKYGTAEYAFLLEELEPLLRRYRTREDLRRAMEPAIQAYRTERDKNMRLYPGALDTLQTVKARGMRVFAFSESKAYYSSYRIAQLGLDGIVDIVYCPEDHELPEDQKSSTLLKSTECHVLEGTFKKPNPKILLKILSDADLKPEEVLYVGDSKSKDIKMAIDSNVDYLWFEHGSAHLNNRKEDYDLLKAVTHWTDSEVETERILAEDSRKMEIPQAKIIHTYPDILGHL
ncbi:HAD family hydrolase [Burkholderia thailandensis]|uniref:HAD family hydrolase n=1 Tax=Burkholderia thailandensis TaxID=57975 RepID=UPI00107E8870|nr:HAD family hydrolase [Burkholderia thailandensis]MCZ2898031.1 HAD family hydrolase [Burkholderia thailandensis]TGB34814.1 HAD family hydrolase [Burkholderia thailandensis]